MKIASLLAISLLAFEALCAQSPRKVVVSPWVGETISREEKVRLRLLPGIPSSRFDSAVVLDQRGSLEEFSLLVYLSTGKQQTQPLSSEGLESLKAAIQKGSEKQQNQLTFMQRRLAASEDPVPVILRTHDGREIRGKLRVIGDDSILIEGESESSLFLWEEIADLQVDDNEKGVIIPEEKTDETEDTLSFTGHPNPLYYIYTPTAWSLPRRGWLYYNQNFFNNQIFYGITDRFTAGSGLGLQFVGGSFGLTLPVSLQYSIPFNDWAYLSTKATAYFNYNLVRVFIRSKLDAMLTVGTPRFHATLGASTTDRISTITVPDASAIQLSLSGQAELGTSFSLVLENTYTRISPASLNISDQIQVLPGLRFRHRQMSVTGSLGYLADIQPSAFRTNTVVVFVDFSYRIR